MRTKTNIGSALLGTLAFAVGGVTLAMGSLKLNKHALNEAKTQTVRFSEENLKQTVQRFLSDETRCSSNLPSDGNQIESLKITDEHGNKNIIIEAKKPFKEGNIDIVDMKLKTDPDDSNKRIFYIYYKKTALGDRQNRNDDDCEIGNNGALTKVKGCYYISCKIDYSNNRCNIDKCSFPDENSQSDSMSCDTDEILDSTNSCVTLQATVFKNINAGIIGQDFFGFTGFEQNSNTDSIQATVVKMSTVCPPGQYPVRQEDGEFVCQIMCTEGSTLEGNRCKCPINTEYKEAQGKCVECPAGSTRAENEPECKCHNGIDLNINNNICGCPENEPHKYKNKCIACTPGSSWNGTECICTGGKQWDSSNNDCQCTSGKYIYEGRCIKCPPYSTWNNNKCNCFIEGQKWNSSSNQCKCKSGQYTYKGRCIKCPAGSGWNNDTKTCECTKGKEWDYFFASKYNLRNLCRCPNNKPYSHNEGCHTCKSNYFYSSQCNICPSNKKHRFFSRCFRCPQNSSHYHNNQCNKCSTRRPNYYRGTCWRCPENYIQYGHGKYCLQCPRTSPHARGGKCCPSAVGDCCMPGYTHSSRRCHKDGRSCEEGRHITNNMCCKNGYYHAGNNMCCPDGYVYTNGNCCENGYFYAGSNVCCPNGTVFSNGSCCLPGYTFDIASQRCFRDSQ